MSVAASSSGVASTAMGSSSSSSVGWWWRRPSRPTGPVCGASVRSSNRHERDVEAPGAHVVNQDTRFGMIPNELSNLLLHARPGSVEVIELVPAVRSESVSPPACTPLVALVGMTCPFCAQTFQEGWLPSHQLDQHRKDAIWLAARTSGRPHGQGFPGCCESPPADPQRGGSGARWAISRWRRISREMGVM